MNQDIAALLGNGVSIAYNPDLQLARINDEITERINREASAGTEPIKLLQRAAANIDTGDPTTDFEALFGPFGQYRDGLQMLKDLAALTGDNTVLQAALTLSADYIEDIRRSGVGHALDVIARRSKAILNGGPEVRDLMGGLVDAAGAGRLTIGNLNYDSLVMASLSESYQPHFCDLADGRQAETYVNIDGYPVRGRLLRTEPCFPYDRSIRLLHLHGSLAWLRSSVDGHVYRFEIGGLRNADYWNKYRTGLTDWVPQVVLTNQATKSAEIAKYPFSLAYDSFEEALTKADRWFIGGYSFRDDCVNELLAKVWRRRQTTPLVLVTTYAKLPSHDQILSAMGYIDWADPDPDEWLGVTRSGVVALPGEQEWTVWEAAARLSKAG